MFSQIAIRLNGRHLGRCWSGCLVSSPDALSQNIRLSSSSSIRPNLIKQQMESEFSRAQIYEKSRSQHLSNHYGQASSRLNLSRSTTRHMSYDSTNEVHNKIQTMLDNSKKPAFLFMKGDPSEPACGFSNVAVQILDAYGVEYDSCNVLTDEKIRSGIKTYSDWPTVPQLFVNKTFVGGCDLLLQMHQSGELEKLFNDAKQALKDSEAKNK